MGNGRKSVGSILEDGEPRFDDRAVLPGFSTGLEWEVEVVQRLVVPRAAIGDNDGFASDAFEDGAEKQ